MKKKTIIRAKSSNFLTGKYPLLNTSFVINNQRYLIRARKKQTTKPIFFLINLDLKPPKNYVSSFFKTEEKDIYLIDYNNFVYKVKWTKEKSIQFDLICKGKVKTYLAKNINQPMTTKDKDLCLE